MPPIYFCIKKLAPIKILGRVLIRGSTQVDLYKTISPLVDYKVVIRTLSHKIYANKSCSKVVFKYLYLDGLTADDPSSL